MSPSINSVQLRRLRWVGPLTVLAAIAGVLVVRVIAIAILNPRPVPMQLGWVMPVVFTTVLVTGAVLVFAVVGRFAPHPIRTYQIIAGVVLLVSLLPDVAFAMSRMPGANWSNAAALMCMHVTAAAITVAMLSGLACA